MRRSRVAAVLVCIAMMIFVGVWCAGCETDDPFETLDVLFSYGKPIQNSEMREELIKPEGMSDQEFNVRVSVEAIDIYNEYKDGDYQEQIFYQPRYGIEIFDRFDSLIVFHDIQDMKKVMSNKAFQKDYRKKFGVRPPRTYYLPKHIDDDDLLADLLAVDEECFFSHTTSVYSKEESWKRYHVFDRQEYIDAQAVASTYATLDGLTPKKAVTDDRDVYYFTVTDHCVLFDALNLRIIGPILTTIYFWEQDGVLGIVTIDGEHAAENLEYCELIKYVF